MVSTLTQRGDSGFHKPHDRTLDALDRRALGVG